MTTETTEEKPKKTPEEKAARQAKRKEKMAAMTPEERKAFKAKRAERKAAKGE